MDCMQYKNILNIYNGGQNWSTHTSAFCPCAFVSFWGSSDCRELSWNWNSHRPNLGGGVISHRPSVALITSPTMPHGTFSYFEQAPFPTQTLMIRWCFLLRITGLNKKQKNPSGVSVWHERRDEGDVKIKTEVDIVRDHDAAKSRPRLKLRLTLNVAIRQRHKRKEDLNAQGRQAQVELIMDGSTKREKMIDWLKR